MTTTEELLKEYANIAGKNDEESIEKAKEFVNDKLNDIENDVAALNNN